MIAGVAALLDMWHNYWCIYRMQRRIYGRIDSMRIAFDVTIKNPPF